MLIALELFLDTFDAACNETFVIISMHTYSHTYIYIYMYIIYKSINDAAKRKFKDTLIQ